MDLRIFFALLLASSMCIAGDWNSVHTFVERNQGVKTVTEANTQKRSAGFRITPLYLGGMTAEAYPAVQIAIDIWESLLYAHPAQLPVTIEFGLANLGNAVGETTIVRVGTQSFDDVKDQIEDLHGGGDNFGRNVKFYVPGGIIVNPIIYPTKANYKGLFPTDTNVDSTYGAVDGGITYSNQDLFDFDPSDGITIGKRDAVLETVYQIGLILGWVSDLDRTSVEGYDNGIKPSVMDIFRYASSTTRTRQLRPEQRAYFGTFVNSEITGRVTMSQGIDYSYSSWGDPLTGMMSSSGERNPVFTPEDYLVLRTIGWQLGENKFRPIILHIEEDYALIGDTVHVRAFFIESAGHPTCIFGGTGFPASSILGTPTFHNSILECRVPENTALQNGPVPVMTIASNGIESNHYPIIISREVPPGFEEQEGGIATPVTYYYYTDNYFIYVTYADGLLDGDITSTVTPLVPPQDVFSFFLFSHGGFIYRPRHYLSDQFTYLQVDADGKTHENVAYLEPVDPADCAQLHASCCNDIGGCTGELPMLPPKCYCGQEAFDASNCHYTSAVEQLCRKKFYFKQT